MTRPSRPPQHRALVRAPDLAAFRSVLASLALDGAPLAARRRLVIVPTRASAELLRQTLEARALERPGSALVLPDLVTRDEWIARLHHALPDAPPLVGRLVRELLLARAARAAEKRGRMPRLPFHLRPGLVAQMLRLYDELRLRQRSVRRFTRALFEELRVERGTDRGSEDLIHQTCFLGFAFLGYERGVEAIGAIDEHGLRRRLLETEPPLPFDHVVVAVADRPSDPRGLWPADFDLLGRLGTLARLDVVMTDETHDAGFRDRLEFELPGIEERRVAAGDDRPVLECRAAPDGPARCQISRDREEELRDIVRVIRARAATTGHAIAAPTAIVFQRPLPYLYLAAQVFDDAAVPFQAFDALPLAGEPFAALLDLTLAVARTGGTRETLVALLRSGLASFVVDGEPVGPRDVAALDAVLAARRSTGDASTYSAEVDAWFGSRPSRDDVEATRARRAARAAAAIAAELAAFSTASTAHEQVSAVAGFLRRAAPPGTAGAVWPDRTRRARAEVLGLLDDLASAYAGIDDGRRDVDELTGAMHHAIEARTFAPGRGRSGVHLVDAVAARFGDFDHVHLAGLVETDWPERTRRSIFYTNVLLTSLGWPQERDHARAELAAFRDLLTLARKTVALHAFQLEGEAIVALSPLIGLAATLPVTERPSGPRALVFSDEVLVVDRTRLPALDAGRALWLDARLGRPALDDPRYRGSVDRQPAQPYRVSKVDRYVECPFKYFAEAVLGLPEEREEVAGLTPLERGTLVHGLFERFYRAWHEAGEGTITAGSLPRAVALFTRFTQDALAPFAAADRVLEETRLLGSLVARGVAERVFELEAERGGRIVDRLLEFDIRGPFTFPRLSGLSATTIAIRGKADRIDVFHDGAIRVVDYKLSRAPNPETSVQIGVYAHCARQQLEAADGRPHPVMGALYLAFGDDRHIEAPIARSRDPVGPAVEARASAFADIIARIEAGDFPARPERAEICQWCRYAGVCRKEYRRETDAAPAL